MTPILIYDTETNGLPVWSMPSDDPCQPRVTQIAAELIDEDTRDVLAGLNVLIRPDGWTIPDDLAALTGITTERAMLFGVPMESAITMFIGLWEKAAFRVAHNESFDMRMIRIELMRHSAYKSLWKESANGPDVEFADFWKSAPAFCTQSNSTKLCNLPPTAKMIAAKRNHAKSPNLTEAYKHFTGLDLVDAHNAATDIMACKAVYFGIKAATAPEPVAA
jgi:DNA polymerase-3 subunit epsilon